MEEESWRRNHGEGVKEKALERNHEVEFIEKNAWRRNQGGETKEESWRRNHGSKIIELKP